MSNETLNLPLYAEDAYLQYAIAVVKSRALAAVEDGLKPVQRRILYAMSQLGLKHPAKAVKSARVVGDVLGKYHPHGDSSVYDALVRMAQPFTLRYPLIDGQGNFGSLDGDPAAAMRYTEARLTPFAELLMSELGQGTVDWVPNYDGTLTEPSLSPARLPELLLNGSKGIAVGMAADIPPHNLREVAAAAELVLSKPDVTLEEILAVLPGPDFPGGGQLVSSPEDIRAAYSKGRGSLRCRARWDKEDLARGQWQVVIKELPYQVSTRVILEEINTLADPAPPQGKKSITPQQANLKAVTLDFLEKAVDESDKDSGIRLVLTPRNSKVDPEALMAFLVANTSLEVGVPLNCTLIGLDKNPHTLNLVDVLQQWAAFRIEVVRRRTQHELEGTQKRIHILQGRNIVFQNLEAVVKVIREAEDPRAELMTRFGLSEVQADDILEMRLRQLNRLEGDKLERELADLLKTEARLISLLGNEKALRALIIEEVRADAAKFGDARRTLLKPEAVTKSTVVAKTVLEEPLTIVVSKNLWVKAYRGHGLANDSFTFKQGDAFWAKVETQSTRPTLVVDSRGRAYSFDSSAVPVGRGEGSPLSTLIEIQGGAHPLALLSGKEEDLYLFASESGYGFLAPLKGLATRLKAGKDFAKPDEGESLLVPIAVPADRSGFVAATSTGNKLLSFNLEEVKELARGGKGVMLMDLGEGEKLSSLRHLVEPQLTLRVRNSKGAESELVISGEQWTRHLSKRARKGAPLKDKQQILG